MAFPTPVNSQITDAVTEANTKVLGDAPAMALGNLFIATSQALSNAAHNAVNAQQQSYVVSQAATTQGVSTLLALDTSSSSLVAGTAGHGQGVALAVAPQAVGAAPAAESGEALDPAMAQLEQALDFADKLVFDSVAPWSHAVREVMAALTDVLHDLEHLNGETNMAMIKQAALAATLARMIAAPDQLEQYQKMIEVIKSL